jgi:hypothetical protein
MIYPVALLIVLLLPHVSAAFAAQASASEPARERGWGDDGEEDQYERGRRSSE